MRNGECSGRFGGCGRSTTGCSVPEQLRERYPTDVKTNRSGNDWMRAPPETPAGCRQRPQAGGSTCTDCCSGSTALPGSPTAMRATSRSPADPGMSARRVSMTGPPTRSQPLSQSLPPRSTGCFAKGTKRLAEAAALVEAERAQIATAQGTPIPPSPSPETTPAWRRSSSISSPPGSPRLPHATRSSSWSVSRPPRVGPALVRLRFGWRCPS